MSILWSYFWPAFGLGLLCGVIAGIFAFRAPRVRVKATSEEVAGLLASWRSRRRLAIILGLLAAAAAVALWNGPLGAADRVAAEIERIARQTLIDRDAPAGVTARVQRGPLTRLVILSGPSDDFQRAEAARLLGEVPGVSSAGWSRTAAVPLIVEGLGTALVGFLLGLGLAYLVELRRRHNSQWNW